MGKAFGEQLVTINREFGLNVADNFFYMEKKRGC